MLVVCTKFPLQSPDQRALSRLNLHVLHVTASTVYDVLVLRNEVNHSVCEILYNHTKRRWNCCVFVISRVNLPVSIVYAPTTPST